MGAIRRFGRNRPVRALRFGMLAPMHEIQRLLKRSSRRSLIAVAIGCALVVAIISAAVPRMAAFVTDFLERVPELQAQGKLRERLLLIGFGLPLLALLQAVFTYGSRILMAKWAQGVLAELRADLYRTLLEKPLSWLGRRHAAEMGSRVTNDVQRIETGLTLRMTDVFTFGPAVPLLVIYLWWTNWKLAAITTLMLPFSGLLIRRWSQRIKKASRKAQEQTASLSNVLAETLGGIRVVKGWGAHEHERKRFATYNDTLRRTNMRAYGTMALSAPVFDVLGAMALAALLVVGGIEISNGDLESADVVGFFTGMTLLYTAVKKTTGSYTELQNTSAAAARCFEILDDQEHEPTGRIEAAPLRLGIDLDNVSFAYGDAPVLSNVTLSIPKGQVIALVGESGSGKSTLTQLIPRFYDVTAGSITWDGLDLREISPASLRRHIALVTQDTIVFDDTVAANIAYADPSPDPERVRDAAKAAHADEFIQELESGYETRLGQGGNRLSGGQRQRIAIARALYRDAPVLILDEATSNLDSQSESLVQDALARLLQGRTALVVAHRLSTVQAADRIVVLAAGRIVQQGTHRELIATPGPYQQLHLLQSGA